MDPMLIAIIAGTIAVVIAVYFMANKLSDTTITKMAAYSAALAKKMGLPAPKEQGSKASAFYVSEIKGTVDHREFSFIQFTRSQKRAGTYVSEFSWACQREVTPRIIISKEGMFSPLSKQLGVTDIIVGDAEFDNEFIIQCDNPDYVKKALNASVRKEILRWQRHWQGTLVIHHHEVHYEEAGIIADEKDFDRFIRLIELGKFIAKSLENLAD
jgi:hypothetical protein